MVTTKRWSKRHGSVELKMRWSKDLTTGKVTCDKVMVRQGGHGPWRPWAPQPWQASEAPRSNE